MDNFRNLLIWQKGIEITKAVYVLVKNLPKEERYGLISQLTRAAVSIPSNIAEGSARSSKKEFNHFLEIALGSAFELETQLIITKELLNKNAEKINQIIKEIVEEQKMIASFQNALRSDQ